jgi:hypothetical protein
MRIKNYNPKLTVFPKLPTIRETREVTVLWTDSEWSYIPELKIRRSFKIPDTSKAIQYTEQSWDGIIPGKVMREERVLYTIYNHRKMWMEVTNQYSELYVIDES